MNLKKFIETRTPFAVVQYFESLKHTTGDFHKKYEVIHINTKKVVMFTKLEGEHLDFFKKTLLTLKKY